MSAPTPPPGDQNPEQPGQTPDSGQAPPPPSYGENPPAPGTTPPAYGQTPPPAYGQTPAYGQAPDPNQQYGYQPPGAYQQPGAYPPPPGGYPPPPGTYDAGYAPAAGYAQPGTLGIRLGARLIDGLIIGIPLAIIFNVLIGASVNNGGTGVVIWLLDLILQPLIITAYYAYMESNSGQTFGHKWLGMKTVRYGTGQLLTFNDSFKRNIVLYIPFIGFIMFIIGAVTINSDPEKRGFHDKLADSQVLKVS
jgi:uncharacterized RDD family membrane protein YckC